MFDRQMDEPLVKPIVALRVMVGAVTILLALAHFVFKDSPSHDMCLGVALGMMVGVCVVSLEISSVDFKRREQPSDVTRNPIT